MPPEFNHFARFSATALCMVFTLDGCPFHYARIRSKSGISICCRKLRFKYNWLIFFMDILELQNTTDTIADCRKLVTSNSSNPIFFSQKSILHNSCKNCSELPSYIGTLALGKHRYRTNGRDELWIFYLLSFVQKVLSNFQSILFAYVWTRLLKHTSTFAIREIIMLKWKKG